MEPNISPEFDVNQFNLLVRTRRSVHPDQLETGKVIPEQIIRQLLENASWAPTHKMTQPWRFMVFSGGGLKKLADFQAGLYLKNKSDQTKDAKYLKLLNTPQLCSHVIALGMKREQNLKIPEIEEIAAVACAVQNLFLSVVAYGLGGYWSTGGITYYEDAKPFFGLGETDRLLGFFYLGYVREPVHLVSRQPVLEKTVWVRE